MNFRLISRWSLFLLVATGLVAGFSAHAKGKKAALSGLPVPVREAIEKFAGNGRISEVEKEKEHGKVVYEAEIEKDGKEFEIEVSVDGKILEVEEEGIEEKETEEKVSLEEIPAVVREAIEQFAEGGKISGIERETTNEEAIFEAEIKKDGKKYEIEVSPAGEILEVE